MNGDEVRMGPNVMSESEFLRRGPRDEDARTYITMDELAAVLRSGGPGEYILRGL